MHKTKSKKYKNILYVFLAALLLVTPFYARAQEMSLKVDGVYEAFRVAPVNIDGYIMMGAYDLLGRLGVTIEWKDSTNTMTAARNGNTLVITVSSTSALVNGVKKTMPKAPFYRKTDLMVPMRFICDALGAEVGWDAKTKTVTLMTGQQANTMQIIQVNRPMTSDYITLTYDQALEDAYKANPTLLNLSESMDYLMEKRTDTLSDILDLASYDMYAQQYILALRGLKTLENTMENIPLNKQMIRETTEYMLRNSIAAIAGGDMDYQLLQANIDLQSQNIKNLKLKKELGMASENDVKTAQQNYDQNKVNLETLKITILSDKNGLSKILMKPLSQEVIVQYEPTVNNAALPTLDQLVTTGLGNDPTVLLQKTAVDEAKYALDSYRNSDQESKLKLETDLTSASRNYEDTKRNLEAAIRSTYYNLKRVQENTKSLQIDLDKAHDAYNTQNVNYKAGLVTIYDLDTAKLGVLKAEIALMKNTYSNWILSYGILHPYLLVNSGT